MKKKWKLPDIIKHLLNNPPDKDFTGQTEDQLVKHFVGWMNTPYMCSKRINKKPLSQADEQDIRAVVFDFKMKQKFKKFLDEETA